MIRMSNITKTYKTGNVEVNALKGINLTISKGEFLAILGPSGSGKSTLMNLIGCLDVPSNGEYYLDEIDVLRVKDDQLATIRNNKIGFIFQKYNLLPRLSALQNVQMPLLFRGINRKQSKEKAIELLQLVGLGERIHHKPSELSGGQQQRVSIARALVGSPSILLADEPTGALDTKSGSEIIEIFTQLNEKGNTVIFITHDQNIAQKSKRIIGITDGNLV